MQHTIETSAETLSDLLREIIAVGGCYLSEDTKIVFSDQAEETLDTIAEILSIIREKGYNVLEAKELLRDTEKLMYLGAHL